MLNSRKQTLTSADGVHRRSVVGDVRKSSVLMSPLQRVTSINSVKLGGQLSPEERVQLQLRAIGANDASSDEEERGPKISNPLAGPNNKQTNEIVKVSMDEQQKEKFSLLRIPENAVALRFHSFNLVSGTNPIRIFVYNVAKHKLFETLIILIIITNCVFLAMDDPTRPDSEEPEYIFHMEIFFTVAFSLEMLMKMFSLGLVLHRGSYLRDPWNILDFTIVLLSYLNFLPGFGNYTAFRTLRVLRPLRSINAIKGLKVLVLGLLQSFRGLLNVMFLAFFIFAIFGILGVQLWNGLFRRHCQVEATGEILQNIYCKDPDQSLSTGYTCPQGQRCITTENPHFGFLSFDNVLWAFLLIFQTITFENWTEALFITYDVFGTPSFIYFFILIMIGSFFVPNLALAVINEKFQTEQRRQELLDERDEICAAAKKEEELKQIGIAASTTPSHPRRSVTNKSTSRRLSTSSHLVTPPTKNLEKPVLVAVGPDDKEWKPQDADLESVHSANEQGDKLRMSRESVSLWLSIRNLCHKVTEGTSLLDPFDEVRGDEDRAMEYENAESSTFTQIIIFCIFLNTIALASQHHNQPQWHTDVLEYSNWVFTWIFAAELLIKLTALGFRMYVRDYFNVLDAIIVASSIVELFLTGSSTVSVFRSMRLLRVLKLLKRFPSLRTIIRVVLNAMANTVYLNLIMCLYLFIAALAGMQFFGGKMKGIEEQTGRPVRAHFDNFLQAFYTVFQVLTLDQWVNVMWNAMEATSPAAVLYFITVILVGDYVILSLFLAILISGFSKQAEQLSMEEAELTLNRRLKDIRNKMIAATAKKFRLSPPDDPRTVMPILPAIQKSIDQHRSHNNGGNSGANSIASISLPPAMMSPRSFGSSSSGGLVMGSPMEGPLMPHLSLMPQEEVFLERCRKCRTVPADVLPTPPLVPQLSVEAHHNSICWMCELRSAKTEVVETVDTYVQQLVDNHVAFSHEYANNVVQQMQLGGMMMKRVTSDFRNWQQLQKAIDDEETILSWEIGEEQIGGALITYTRANAKNVHRTNGGTSLFLFGPKQPFRLLLSELVHSSIFEGFILCCIVLSSVALALDNPREDQTTTKYTVLFYLDLVFTTIFVVEMLFKIVARGLVAIEGAYLRDSWNVLDCTIVFISVLSLSLRGVDIAFLKVVRTFRALRPLRVIHRNRGLKMVVRTLLASVKGIANVALLATLNYLIFGILAVQLFSGKLNSCTDVTITTEDACMGTYYDAALERELTRRWVPNKRNFDHIGTSILTLFEVSAGELWIDIMYNAIDARSATDAPRRDENPAIGLFFVIFFVISNFFMLNLFVGVVINNFNSVKSQMDGLSLMTDEQKLWVETQRLMLNFRPTKAMRPGKNKASQWAFDIAVRDIFEAVIGLAIILNIVVISLDHYGMSSAWETALSIANLVFVVIFLVEAILKLTAFGRDYFYSRWNQFDFFLVVISIVGVSLTYTQGSVLPIDVGLLRVFRIFRIMRILRLVKQARQVRILIETLWYSLPSIGNISVFMLLIYFIYAVMGMQLFGKVQAGTYLNDRYANYHSFFTAMQMQFIFTTGEDWNSMMHDCMVRPPDCEGDSCGTLFAPLFFTSFMLISAFVITNLFIAIILDNFETTIRLDRSNLTMSDLHRYVDIWARYDPDATMFISTEQFPPLLADLQPPLGISRKYSRLEVLQKTSFYRVPERDGMVHFVEVLIPLARACLDVDLTEREVREHEESWKNSFPGLDELPVRRYRNAQVCVDAYFCSTYLAAAYKRRQARRLADKMRQQRREDIDDYVRSRGLSSTMLFSKSTRPLSHGSSVGTASPMASPRQAISSPSVGSDTMIGSQRTQPPPMIEDDLREEDL